jgi:hypothetical protein
MPRGMAGSYGGTSDEWLDGDDKIDEYHEKLDEARTEIERFVESILITTYAALARRYPEWSHMLDDILTSSDKIEYSNIEPAPSKVRFREASQLRVAETLGFNNQPREKFNEMIESRKRSTKKTKVGEKIAEALAA